MAEERVGVHKCAKSCNSSEGKEAKLTALIDPGIAARLMEA